jgi:single-strand selective monofunctional uracil DNA glycosylase
MSLITISRELSRSMAPFSESSGAAFTYNPLEYAQVPHELYLKKYGKGKKEVLLLGMNPGPFGMAQTGVPFGDVGFVRDWMKISGPVDAPTLEHPKRKITGFACEKSEVSGTRLWSFARDRFETPEAFFQRFFVVNYCPLVFMEPSGKNLTPDKLARDVREPLFAACDKALRAMTIELKPKWVLGVGAFAQKQAIRALSDLDVRIGTILHPSPASPLANRGWAGVVAQQFDEMGIPLPQVS